MCVCVLGLFLSRLIFPFLHQSESKAETVGQANLAASKNQKRDFTDYADEVFATLSLRRSRDRNKMAVLAADGQRLKLHFLRTLPTKCDRTWTVVDGFSCELSRTLRQCLPVARVWLEKSGHSLLNKRKREDGRRIEREESAGQDLFFILLHANINMHVSTRTSVWLQGCVHVNASRAKKKKKENAVNWLIRTN